MNVGTIIDSGTFKVITSRGKLLGTVEESFFNSIKVKYMTLDQTFSLKYLSFA